MQSTSSKHKSDSVFAKKGERELEIFRLGLADKNKVKNKHLCVQCEQFFLPNDMSKCNKRCNRWFCITCVPEDKDIENFTCLDCEEEKYCCYTCQRVDNNVVQCRFFGCERFYHLSCASQWIHNAFLPLTDLKAQSVLCPLHYCSSCLSDEPEIKGPHRAFQSELLQCLRCPRAYHEYDVPAGSHVTGGRYILCADHFKSTKPHHAHVNITWCNVCTKKGGGVLYKCQRCPSATHKQCLGREALPDAANYVCRFCLMGGRLRTGDIVWVKFMTFRWWPGEIMMPDLLPDNIAELSTTLGEFPVRFFGTADYEWMCARRTVLFQEAELILCKDRPSGAGNEDYRFALDDVFEAYPIWQAEQERLYAERFNEEMQYQQVDIIEQYRMTAPKTRASKKDAALKPIMKRPMLLPTAKEELPDCDSISSMPLLKPVASVDSHSDAGTMPALRDNSPPPMSDSATLCPSECFSETTSDGDDVTSQAESDVTDPAADDEVCSSELQFQRAEERRKRNSGRYKVEPNNNEVLLGACIPCPVKRCPDFLPSQLELQIHVKLHKPQKKVSKKNCVMCPCCDLYFGPGSDMAERVQNHVIKHLKRNEMNGERLNRLLQQLEASSRFAQSTWLCAVAEIRDAAQLHLPDFKPMMQQDIIAMVVKESSAERELRDKIVACKCGEFPEHPDVHYHCAAPRCVYAARTRLDAFQHFRKHTTIVPKDHVHCHVCDFVSPVAMGIPAIRAHVRKHCDRGDIDADGVKNIVKQVQNIVGKASNSFESCVDLRNVFKSSTPEEAFERRLSMTSSSSSKMKVEKAEEGERFCKCSFLREPHLHCEVSKCPFTTKDQERLENHTKRHKTVEAAKAEGLHLQCPICLAAFKNPQTMEKHNKHHERLQAYEEKKAKKQKKEKQLDPVDEKVKRRSETADETVQEMEIVSSPAEIEADLPSAPPLDEEAESSVAATSESWDCKSDAELLSNGEYLAALCDCDKHKTKHAHCTVEFCPNVAYRLQQWSSHVEKHAFGDLIADDSNMLLRCSICNYVTTKSTMLHHCEAHLKVGTLTPDAIANLIAQVQAKTIEKFPVQLCIKEFEALLHHLTNGEKERSGDVSSQPRSKLSLRRGRKRRLRNLENETETTQSKKQRLDKKELLEISTDVFPSYFSSFVDMEKRNAESISPSGSPEAGSRLEMVLDKVADDDLLNELFKRGLMVACVCGLMFKDKALCQYHAAAHDVENALKCGMCAHETENWLDFFIHVNSHEK